MTMSITSEMDETQQDSSNVKKMKSVFQRDVEATKDSEHLSVNLPETTVSLDFEAKYREQVTVIQGLMKENEMLEQIKMQLSQNIASLQEQSAQDGEEIAHNRTAVDEANQNLIMQQAQYD